MEKFYLCNVLHGVRTTFNNYPPKDFIISIELVSNKNSGMQVAVLNKKIKADLYLANLLY